MRIGQGYDVHAFCENQPLILGGVNIPYEKGLLGHSDADVLTHSICDALLGAAALGDIGVHFPDNDKAYEGICSLELLKKVGKLLLEKGYQIENIDATVVAEKPKLSSFIENMKTNISECLNIPCGSVSVKATTQEGLGFAGRKEGISAFTVCLINSEKIL